MIKKKKFPHSDKTHFLYQIRRTKVPSFTSLHFKSQQQGVRSTQYRMNTAENGNSRASKENWTAPQTKNRITKDINKEKKGKKIVMRWTCRSKASTRQQSQEQNARSCFWQQKEAHFCGCKMLVLWVLARIVQDLW